MPTCGGTEVRRAMPVRDEQGRVIRWFDGMRLKQVAMSLLSNAIKFGAGKPIHVRLHVPLSAAVR